MFLKLFALTLIALAFSSECRASEPMRQRADALQGKVETVDIDPAGMNGSIGVVSGGLLRNVTCGNHFYVVKDNGTSVLGGEHAQWLKWYQDLCTRIARKWCEHTVIGNVQVTATLGPDKKFKEISIHASAPAVGSDGNFNNSPGYKDACDKAAIDILRSMEAECPELQFPFGLSAKAVVMSLTLSADADAVLPYPDLSPVALIPHDQKLQRLARTADILDTGWYVQTASFVRQYLPAGMREQLIGDHTHHALDMGVDADLASCDFGMSLEGARHAADRSMVALHEDGAKHVLQTLIDARDYVSAEEFAKRLVLSRTPQAVDRLLAQRNLYRFEPIACLGNYATIKFGGNVALTSFKEARPNQPRLSELPSARQLLAIRTPITPARQTLAIRTPSTPAATPVPPNVSPNTRSSETPLERQLAFLNGKIKDCYSREDWEGARDYYSHVIPLLVSSNADPQAVALAKKNNADLSRRINESRAARPTSISTAPTRTTVDTTLSPPGRTIKRGTGIVGFKFVLSLGKPPIINRVYPGTAAARAGIEVEDAIQSINGTSTYGLTKEQVYELITGKPGTHVDFVLLRRNNAVRVQCTRMDLADIEDPVVKRDYLISR